MAKVSDTSSEGLFSSLANLASSLVAIIHTRLDLLSSDIEEGRQRLMSLLVIAFVSLFCLCVGVVFLTILIVVFFWDTHRVLVLTFLTSIFLISGVVLSAIALRSLKTMPRMFKDSLAELLKDQEQINSGK